MRPISAEAYRGLSHLTSGTSKGPSHPCCNSRSSPTYPCPLERKHESSAHIQRSPVSYSCSRERILSLRDGKEFPAFLLHLKRRGSPQESREKLQSRATIPKVPQMSQSIPGKPVFPALPRLSGQGSTHSTVARGTALWERLVGKPRGKATDPLIQAKESVTLLLQLERKAHVQAPSRDED